MIGKTNPRPYLSEMVQVVFKRESLQLEYKTAYDSPNSIKLSFLQNKFVKKNKIPKPLTKTKLRGVNKEKQVEIMTKLIPLMPKNRHTFWENLLLCDVPDLVVEVDDN